MADNAGKLIRDRRHVGWRNPGPVLQLGVSKLARDPANCSGRPVWRRRGSRDQCRLAHCMPLFDAVACAGSARSSDHRHSGLRSSHRAFLRKSQIAHRRQTFLSAGASLNVDAETLRAPKEFRLHDSIRNLTKICFANRTAWADERLTTEFVRTGIDSAAAEFRYS